ncbi:HIT domain-containing protein [Candidatus Woesearchaeota archaeon]|nr:HIT domain-containing protein [Candidatus Woesearchaeota archaeon]
MKNCIFCKIISNEIDSAKIWEDNKFIAILDINPNTKGMNLVLSKEHYSSYAFDLQDDILKDIIIATKKIAKILEKSLKVKRVAMVMEGMGIDHLHIKLYPLYGLKEKFEEIWQKIKSSLRNIMAIYLLN